MEWTRLIRTVAPTVAPLTVDDIKTHLAIAHVDEDDLLETLIAAAAAFIDGPNGAGVALMTQTYRLSLDLLPRSVCLPIGPVQAVQSVTVGGVALDPSSYSLDADRTPAVLHCTSPSYSIAPGSVKITFVAGYGDTGADIPADLRHAIRMIVGHLYENREATAQIEVKMVPMAVETILSRYRVLIS